MARRKARNEKKVSVNISLSFFRHIIRSNKKRGNRSREQEE